MTFVRTLLASFLVLSAPAFAGNIALTGHDDDYHASYDNTALAQLGGLVNFARNGSALPVLAFDQGYELTSALDKLGVGYTRVDPSVAIDKSLFNNAQYSAFVVASDYTCGGCDNTPTGTANLVAVSDAIASFFNAGGGIVGLSGASNASTYYGFLPSSASGFGEPPIDGYVQTAFGASIGIPPVNGDPTHNFFYTPGTNGVSSAYQVVEGLGDYAETIACAGCSISGTVIVPDPTPTPEPTTLALLGLGAAGMGALRRKKRA